MLEVARSHRIVTPHGAVAIAGHAMRTEKSVGVHDELEVHVLLLNLEGQKCCFINADLIGVSFKFMQRIKDTVHEKYNIDAKLTVFSVTHTHTGPYFGLPSNMGLNPEYEEYVFAQTMEAIEEASNNYMPFDTVTVAQDEVKGYYGNRNSLEKVGDEMITVLRFKQADKTVAALVNMSCHSTVMNPLELNLSADLLGNVRRELIPVLQVEPLMTNGNAGDISNRLYRQNNDFNELKRVTSGIAAQISTWTQETVIKLNPVQACDFHYQVEYEQDKPALEKALKELEAKLKSVTEFDARKWLLSEIAGYKRKLAMEHVSVCLDGTVIRMQDLEIVVVPCEMASAFGKQIKRSSNAKVCLVWGYANGCSTYVVEASEFNGGHDGISTQLKKGQAEEYIGKIIQTLF